MIDKDNMVPVELLLLKPILHNNSLSPTAFYLQWLELNEPVAWGLVKGHAYSQGVTLPGFFPFWKLMKD